jgi:hypothetical protein
VRLPTEGGDSTESNSATGVVGFSSLVQHRTRGWCVVRVPTRGTHQGPAGHVLGLRGRRGSPQRGASAQPAGVYKTTTRQEIIAGGEGKAKSSSIRSCAYYTCALSLSHTAAGKQQPHTCYAASSRIHTCIPHPSAWRGMFGVVGLVWSAWCGCFDVAA